MFWVKMKNVSCILTYKPKALFGQPNVSFLSVLGQYFSMWSLDSAINLLAIPPGLVRSKSGSLAF